MIMFSSAQGHGAMLVLMVSFLSETKYEQDGEPSFNLSHTFLVGLPWFNTPFLSKLRLYPSAQPRVPSRLTKFQQFGT